MRVDAVLAAALVATAQPAQSQTASYYWGDASMNLAGPTAPAPQTSTLSPQSWPLTPPTSSLSPQTSSLSSQTSSIPWLLRGYRQPTNSSIWTSRYSSQLNATSVNRLVKTTSSTFMMTPSVTTSEDGAFTTDSETTAAAAATTTTTSPAAPSTSTSGARTLSTLLFMGGAQSVWLGLGLGVALAALQL
ncbi:hypothetical protein XA68_13676 [Ophiocordyceps unilateralis]|uniref:Uncharacterized protein n=1 Tax=Ophiocordyceps unilateralis TaxID=268505 RepID=A0A2A9PAX4_OPHUN|nr:hypothetical protein XA68_13676 [Ophiocordyceps unilateralis]